VHSTIIKTHTCSRGNEQEESKAFSLHQTTLIQDKFHQWRSGHAVYKRATLFSTMCGMLALTCGIHSMKTWLRIYWTIQMLLLEIYWLSSRAVYKYFFNMAWHNDLMYDYVTAVATAVVM